MSRSRLTVLCAHRSALGPSWRVRDDLSSHARLYLITSGRGTLWLFGRHHELEPGFLYLIPPRSGASFWTDGAIGVDWAHFTLDLDASLSVFDFFPAGAPCRLAASDEAGGWFEGMVRCCAGELTSEKAFQAKGRLYLLLAGFFAFREAELDNGKRRAYERLRPALEHIEARLRGRVEVAELARKCHFDRAYFSTLFAQVFHAPPSRYIMSRRIELAKGMLRRGDEKLEVVARELGFNDAFHFSKTFKRLTGESPSQFRQSGRPPAP